MSVYRRPFYSRGRSRATTIPSVESKIHVPEYVELRPPAARVEVPQPFDIRFTAHDAHARYRRDFDGWGAPQSPQTPVTRIGGPSFPVPEEDEDDHVEDMLPDEEAAWEIAEAIHQATIRPILQDSIYPSGYGLVATPEGMLGESESLMQQQHESTLMLPELFDAQIRQVTTELDGESSPQSLEERLEPESPSMDDPARLQEEHFQQQMRHMEMMFQLHAPLG